MANSRKTIVFIISLIAYFIYLSISSGFISSLIGATDTLVAVVIVYISSGIGVFVVLYAQAAVKYFYTSRFLRGAKVFVTVPIAKARLFDRLLIYILPMLSIIVPLLQTRSLASITPDSLIFTAAVILIVEMLFILHKNSMKAYVTDKGLFIKGIDLRLELPISSNYSNPSGYFPFERIIHFLDLNDRIQIEQSYDLGVITLKGDPETLKQIKALFLANKVVQKKY